MRKYYWQLVVVEVVVVVLVVVRRTTVELAGRCGEEMNKRSMSTNLAEEKRK